MSLSLKKQPPTRSAAAIGSINQYLAMDLLRFTTADVDDGKSTLIGRMLYDSKAIR